MGLFRFFLFLVNSHVVRNTSVSHLGAMSVCQWSRRVLSWMRYSSDSGNFRSFKNDHSVYSNNSDRFTQNCAAHTVFSFIVFLSCVSAECTFELNHTFHGIFCRCANSRPSTCVHVGSDLSARCRIGVKKKCRAQKLHTFAATTKFPLSWEILPRIRSV